MKKTITIAELILSGCSSMPERTCTAVYESGVSKYSVYVFGYVMRGDEMLLMAGYPFYFRYISERNFKSHDCSI